MTQEQLINAIKPVFKEKLRELMLEEDLIEDLERVYLPLANLINVAISGANQMKIIGINGSQGSGKTTFCSLMKIVLEEGLGLKVVHVGIDDLYLSRADRQQLAKNIHPLLITRGVPGTHNVDQGIQLFNALSNATPTTETAIPAFDKATDNPYPKEKWPLFKGRPDVILFEGWFVGAEPQPMADLMTPVNEMEEEEDPRCVWRTYVNMQLKEVYKDLFDYLDLLVMLQVPSFEKVYEWRELQEAKLRITTQGEDNLRVMNTAEVRHFISHFERLTRWMLKEMPQRADMLFKVNTDHRICLL